ncbi:MAG: hypothetical protein HFG50_15825 [Lachnospiraceae bacterium]|jgi:hypothetical protein|nr:hypothetical protein [Lachnospiraceae bacterium]
MRDFLLLCSTLALLLSGFIAMNRLDSWIEHEQQRILDEYQKSHWISRKICDKIFLPGHAANYRGTWECSSYKKGI